MVQIGTNCFRRDSLGVYFGFVPRVVGNMLVAANSELPWPVAGCGHFNTRAIVPPWILWFFLLSAFSRALLPRLVREEIHFLSSPLSLADFGEQGVPEFQEGESEALWFRVSTTRGVSFCLF